MLVCCILVGATAYRTYRNYSQPGKFDWQNRGLSDFHNGTYFPSLAFRQKVNPYSKDVMDQFDVASPSRPCPPITYIIHQPFTFFSLHQADCLFFVYNTLLIFALAGFTLMVVRRQFQWGWFLFLSSILLVCRPGHISLFTGYYTLELVLATLVALHFAKTRPWIAAIGMLIASSKPTYILPLILLMLARKNFRATTYGIGLCAIAGVAGVLWLAQESSIEQVVEGIKSGQEAFHAEEEEFPVNSWTRIDLLGMIAKFANWIPGDEVYLAAMLGLLIVPGTAIWRITDAEKETGASGQTGLISLLAILVTIYHHSYDCLLIFLPWVAVTFFGRTNLTGLSRRTKTALSLLLSVPLFNYLSTRTARTFLGLDSLGTTWQAVTVLNSICLLIALVLVLIASWPKTNLDFNQDELVTDKR